MHKMAAMPPTKNGKERQGQEGKLWARAKVPLTVAGVLLPLVAGLLLAFKAWGPAALFWPRATLSMQGAAAGLFAEARAAYEKGAYDRAATLLAGHWEDLSEEAEGCELLVSVYAEQKDMASLTAAARLCLDKNRGEGIAHEGLAFGLAAQGQIADAIAQLEAAGARQPAHGQVPMARADVALARLYLMVGRDGEAAKLFVGAVASSDSWSLWLGEALKQPRLTGSPHFLRAVIGAVIHKEKVVASLEQRLFELANEHGLKDEAQRLHGRLMKVNHNESS